MRFIIYSFCKQIMKLFLKYIITAKHYNIHHTNTNLEQNFQKNKQDEVILKHFGRSFVRRIITLSKLEVVVLFSLDINHKGKIGIIDY